MKKFFAKGIVFLKENPSIIYSLVLVVIIPFAFFINTYIINSKYEKNIDAITQRKAAMMESIINNLIKDKLENLDVLQRTLDDIKKASPSGLFHAIVFIVFCTEFSCISPTRLLSLIHI